jgi:hypothetical protein
VAWLRSFDVKSGEGDEEGKPKKKKKKKKREFGELNETKPHTKKGNPRLQRKTVNILKLIGRFDGVSGSKRATNQFGGVGRVHPKTVHHLHCRGGLHLLVVVPVACAHNNTRV